jgi:hypothetical protein
MTDIRDIYAHVTAIENELAYDFDLHRAESGCRGCHYCDRLDDLMDMTTAALRVMEPDMIGQSTAIAATFVPHQSWLSAWGGQ